MPFNLEPNQDFNTIENITGRQVTLDKKTYSTPILFTPKDCIWPIKSSQWTHIDDEDWALLATLDIDVLLIGTGEKHLWPDAQRHQQLKAQPYQTETMTNKALARTYTLLASEQRKVACMLFFDNVTSTTPNAI